ARRGSGGSIGLCLRSSKPCTTGSDISSASGPITSPASRKWPSEKPKNVPRATARRPINHPLQRSNVMVAEETKSAIRTFNVVKEVLIAAPADVVFETVLEPHGPMKEMNMKLEAWVGGRWFRDL